MKGIEKRVQSKQTSMICAFGVVGLFALAGIIMWEKRLGDEEE